MILEDLQDFRGFKHFVRISKNFRQIFENSNHHLMAEKSGIFQIFKDFQYFPWNL